MMAIFLINSLHVIRNFPQMCNVGILHRPYLWFCYESLYSLQSSVVKFILASGKYPSHDILQLYPRLLFHSLVIGSSCDCVSSLFCKGDVILNYERWILPFCLNMPNICATQHSYSAYQSYHWH